MLVALAFLPDPTLKLRHHIVVLTSSPGVALPTRLSAICCAFLQGFFVDGGLPSGIRSWMAGKVRD